jgi:hypothetical protein
MNARALIALGFGQHGNELRPPAGSAITLTAMSGLAGTILGIASMFGRH